MKRLLSDIEPGQRVTIHSTRDSTAERRLLLCGLIEGVQVTLERPLGSSDSILRHDGRRFRFSRLLAQRIWVTVGAMPTAMAN